MLDNVNKVLHSETFDFNGVEIRRGDLVRLEKDKSRYYFYEYATNVETGSDWITLNHETHGYFYSVKPHRLIGLATSKKTGAKKNG